MIHQITQTKNITVSSTLFLLKLAKYYILCIKNRIYAFKTRINTIKNHKYAIKKW